MNHPDTFAGACGGTCGLRTIASAVAAIAAAVLAPVASAQVRIMEVQSVNVGGITDEDGTPQPWIEIWNPSATAARTLTNYKLTNGTTTWALPGTTTATSLRLAPDERIVIWASGKNRDTITAPLHTSFTLAAAGGSIRLLDASDNVVSAIENYPALQADHSWGRDEADTSAVAAVVGDYSVPSPGERNNYEGPGVAGTVVFDRESQAFSDSLSVSLSLAVPDAGTVIRYTTNRSVPVADSPLYEGPIAVDSTSMIRARAFKSGLLPGATASHAYLSLSPEAAAFTSTMPVIVLSNFRSSTIPENGDQDCFVWIWHPAGAENLVRLTNPPDFASRSVTDKRGSSTLGNPKFNLNLEFRSQWDEEEVDYALLGMSAHSDWVLNAPYEFDRSLLHNPFIFSLSRQIGRYATDTRMAEMFVDVSGGTLRFTGSSSGDYFGVYNIHEKIRRGSARLGLTRLDPDDNEGNRVTGGYIWKVDRRDAGDTGFTAGGQGSLAYYYPKEVEIKSAQRDPQEKYLTSYINSFNSSLTSKTYDQWLDVPAAIDHHLLNVWSFNVDALRLSGFWHKDRGGLMIAGPIWDFDRALSSTDGRDANPTVWRSKTGDLGTDFFNYTWWNRLFQDYDFYQKYIDRWQFLRQREFSAANVNNLLDELNAQFSEEALARDLARWRKVKRRWPQNSAETAWALNPVTTASQAAEVQRLKDYLQVRADFMDSQWVGPVTPTPAPGPVAPGTQVTLTGPGGVPIYYTLDGSDPRPSGGGAPAAGVAQYSGPIAISATTRVNARAYDAGHTALTGSNNPPRVSKWGGLASLRYSTDPVASSENLVLSEIHYHPADPTPAELAIDPDWGDNSFEFLELWNRSGSTIDLQGVRITGAVEFTFAGDEGMSLPPGSPVVVCGNATAFAARYPGVAALGTWDGSLNNSSEEVRVLDAAGNLIMTVTYDDGWEPSTDGNGSSLVAYRLNATAAEFDSQANWRASALPGGSPGAADASTAPDGPAVSAGPDVSGEMAGIVISGSVSGWTEGDPVLAWSKVSGPGTVTFEPDNAAATTATFSGNGSYVLRLTATSGDTSLSDDVTVSVGQPPDPIIVWQAQYPQIGDLTDDYDADGYSNFAEYAFGADPTLPGDEGTPVFEVSDGHLTITFTRLKSPAVVTYVPETGSSLDAFTPAPGDFTESVLSETSTTELVRLTDSATIGAANRKFVRLRVTNQ